MVWCTSNLGTVHYSFSRALDIDVANSKEIVLRLSRIEVSDFNVELKVVFLVSRESSFLPAKI